MKTAIIVRGPSGSGKSTFIRKRWGGTPHSYCSADLFFIRQIFGKSEYKCDPTKLGEAHAKCLADFLLCLSQEEELVIVDNTFTRHWEYSNYVAAAKLAGYVVKIYEMRIQTFEEARKCACRNTHAVPANIVYAMCCEFEANQGAEVVPFQM